MSTSLFRLLPQLLLSLIGKKRCRTHRYGPFSFECEYNLDPIAMVMTSQRSHVERGDRIEVRSASTLTRYRVIEIDYYSEPSDMWIAKLTKIPE